MRYFDYRSYGHSVYGKGVDRECAVAPTTFDSLLSYRVSAREPSLSRAVEC